MKQLLVWLLLAGALPARSEAPQAKDELFGEIDSILASLGRITGWKAKRKVPAFYITRDKLRQFVESRLKQEVKQDEVRIEEQILEMFGLVPRNFDLRKSTVDLITEQAAAFYDYNARKLFVLETNESTLERRVTLAHELAHALADQQFSLRKYIRGGMRSDDMSAARQAAVEGQATWLMWAYMAVRNGKEPAVPIELLANAAVSAEGGAAAGFPVLAESPLYLRESLIFPYTRGLLFQNEIYKMRGKDGFREVFARPPDSTQQILHPERWASGVAAESIEPPAIPERKRYRLRAEGTVGEFDHKILVRQFIGEPSADRIAPLWRSGAYRLYHEKKSAKPLLAYASGWGKPETATWYLALYKGVVAKKSKDCKFTVDTPDRVEGSNEYGRFKLWTAGGKVLALEGL